MAKLSSVRLPESPPFLSPCYRQKQKVEQARRTLETQNLQFIERGPVLACVPVNTWNEEPPPALWAAVREVRFGDNVKRLDHHTAPDVNIDQVLEFPRRSFRPDWKVLCQVKSVLCTLSCYFLMGKPRSLPRFQFRKCRWADGDGTL
jgi:hypothetical protein